MSLRLDTSSQRRRRLHFGRSCSRQRHRSLLVGETIGQLGGRRDACLEYGTTLRRERSVGKRRELCELLANAFLSTSPQHRHGNGNRES
jgi:hypothetical protein